MEISIHSLLEGTARATGTVALIDVFRAFTSTAVALANGATGIVMVGTVTAMSSGALCDPVTSIARMAGARCWSR